MFVKANPAIFPNATNTPALGPANQDAKKIVKISSLSVLFLFIVIFAFWGSKDLIFGVIINDVNIINTIVTYWVVTAVDGQGRESGNSNQVNNSWWVFTCKWFKLNC